MGTGLMAVSWDLYKRLVQFRSHQMQCYVTVGNKYYVFTTFYPYLKIYILIQIKENKEDLELDLKGTVAKHPKGS